MNQILRKFTCSDPDIGLCSFGVSNSFDFSSMLAFGQGRGTYSSKTHGGEQTAWFPWSDLVTLDWIFQ